MKLKVFCDKIPYKKNSNGYYIPSSPIVYKGFEVSALKLERPRKDKQKEGRSRAEVTLILKKRFGDEKFEDTFKSVGILGKNFLWRSFRLKYSYLNRIDLSVSCYYEGEFPKELVVCFYFERLL